MNDNKQLHTGAWASGEEGPNLTPRLWVFSAAAYAFSLGPSIRHQELCGNSWVNIVFGALPQSVL